MVTWEIHPRNADLSRTLDPLSRWSRLVLVERHNVADTWTVSGPSSVLSAFAPGMGCILDRNGEQITSGQVRSIERSYQADPDTGRVEDRMTVGFISDLAPFGGRVSFPDPAKVLTTSPSTFSVAYDTRTGTVEDLIIGFVSSNLGPLALADRRLAGLLLPTSLGRGGATRYTARFDPVGTIVHKLAERGGLRVTVQHDESTGTPRLALRIEAVPDVSDDVRFGPAGTTATGIVTSWRYALEAPTATRAIVLGGGEKAARQVIQVKDTAAEALWGMVVEQAVDQRQTTDATELAQAGQEELASAAGAVEVAFAVADGPDVQYRRDYGIGYRVGVDLPGLPDAATDNVVREITTTVEANPGEKTEQIRVVVGTADASTQQSRSARRVARALRRVASLERSS